MAIVLGQGDPIAVAGIVGGLTLGYYLGSKLRHVDASAPGLCAVLGAIFGSFLLRLVLQALLICGLLVGPPLLLWYCRDIIRRFATSFGQTVGVTYNQLLSRRSHRQKLQTVEQNHQERLAALYEADIPRDSLEKLLEQERRRFDTELQDVSRIQ